MKNLKLVYDESKQAVGCALLANEIGARLDGNEQDIPLIPLFICELLDQIIANRAAVGTEHKHPICSIAVTIAWAFRHNVRNGPALIARAKAFSQMIHEVDDNDGWPDDRWLNAVLGCCIAIELGLGDRARTRWPAEAAGEVWALVARLHEPGVHGMDARKGWICQRFSAARRAARRLAQ